MVMDATQVWQQHKDVYNAWMLPLALNGGNDGNTLNQHLQCCCETSIAAERRYAVRHNRA